MSLSAHTFVSDFSKGDHRHVLIVRTGAMGDVLHAMPAVAALRANHPEWTIGWAIEPRWRALLEAGGMMPLVDRVHDVPTRDWNRRPLSVGTLRKVLAVRQELRSAHYDLCVDMQGLLRSAVVGRFAGARVFAGYAAPREGVARCLYSLRVRTKARHVIDRGCELLRTVVREQLRAAPVPLPRDAAAEVWCDELLTQSVPARSRFAVLAPTAGWGAKQWPAQRYGALASQLVSAGWAVLVNAAHANDAVVAAVVLASEGQAVPVVCSLAELIALLRRAGVVIAGDTGPLHLAATLGKPVVGLYGPTDPARTGPYGTRCEVLRHVTSRVDHRRHIEPDAGLLRIGVDAVMDAVERVAST